jgi:hypothetical protein
MVSGQLDNGGLAPISRGTGISARASAVSSWLDNGGLAPSARQFWSSLVEALEVT